MECAVLFADVAGSTALYELLGDERAFAAVERCLESMSACTAQAQGRVIKTIGDAVLAVFPGADEAADAAAAMHERVVALGPELGTRLALRIGFHFGPVVAHDHDVFGDTVNLASRLCDLAYRGQTVTDADTAARLAPRHAANLRPLFAIPVKGKAQDVALVEVMWQAARDDMTAILHAPAAKPHAEGARLALAYGGAQVEMGPQRRKVSFGRDASSNFTVHSPGVSRAHATIERRREHFVLVDHSANGTWVSFEGRPEIQLHHEELTLFGRGCVAFGQPRGEAAHCLEFECLEPTAEPENPS